MGLRSELVRRGVTEGLLQDKLRRRPGILHTPAPRPLIVVGLPRTGTTLLHAPLGCDPAALAGLAQSMAPRLRDVHPVSALRPEEDVFDHHRGRGSPHRYSLAGFGLDRAAVDRRFARYRQWLDGA